jgi:protein TonB
MKIILTLTLLLCFCSINAQTDTAKIISTDSAIYFNPEVPAEFPGGLAAWYKHLQKTLNYPDEAVRKNIQGTVVTQFIIDSTGSAHDFTVISGPEELRAECIRVLKVDMLWEPAINHGKKVNSWKTQPINFHLERH